MDHARRTLLDAARTEPDLRERRRLLLASGGYLLVFAFSAVEVLQQTLSRRIVDRPERWFPWVVFGIPGLVSLFMSISRYLVARSLGNRPGWSADSLSRLPPGIARLVGLSPSSESSPPPRGFALAGGLFVGGQGQGGDLRAGTEMTTPEVLRSTSLRSRSAVRNSSTTPQQGGGAGSGATPVRGTPSERRLFSPEDSSRRAGKDNGGGGGGGGVGGRGASCLTPADLAKAGRRAIAVRPQDVEGLMKEYDERHAKPKPSEAASQAYEADATEVDQGTKGQHSDKDKAKQLLLRLGIAGKTDDFTKNVKTYVVHLMKRYLSQFERVCSLLEERGVSPAILRQEAGRQPHFRIRSSPRAFVNLSLKDMTTMQFSNQPDFLVQAADGQQTSLFREYQASLSSKRGDVLEEALHVTAGSGVAGAGNPAYVLSRLKVLCDDEFMSAFEYAAGEGYPSGREWGPDLPTDAAIVMRLFVCCSDDLLPRGWDDDRPFARQFFVDRDPLREDALPGRFFLARNGVLHPPHFFVVANQEKWNTLPGSTNVFQAIALFFYAIKTHKSSYLGTGVSVADIVQEIFG
ncbi:unnamed protein product [Pylaiella littoralis]